MENHNNLYRTMLFGLSILAGGQLGYATISADDASSSQVTASEQVTTSEVSSESEQADQGVSETTAPVSQSTTTVSSSQVDEAELSSSKTESTDEQGGLSSRATTPSTKVDHRSGYVYAPEVSQANGGWNWLEDGQPYTGFRKYQGAYYWFQNGIRQNNQWETAWGHKYYVGANGRAVQGTQWINGKRYNFGTNGTFYLRNDDVSGYINVPGVGWRWLEKGQLYSGFRYYMGAYYWFQNGVRQNNQWETAWGNKYYVGADGRAVQGLRVINNQIYNFGTNKTFYQRALPSGYVNVSGLGWRWIENEQLFTGFRHYKGSYYWFENGVRQNNQWETAWGNKYYVGADGRAVQGIVTINGVKHNFGTNGTFYERAMPKQAAKPYYYSQWDKRWANTWLSGGTFGATGCVPTSVAMVLKGSYGVNVTPRQVGNQVSQFHESYGASGLDLKTMVNAYGHQAQSLSTANAVKSALKQGKPVIFFVNVGIGHAVVGYGYNQGNTEIFDPYNHQFYSGWNSVDGILSKLSKDSQDWDAGTPAFAIN